MIKKTDRDAYSYHLNSPVFGQKRSPKHALDFGDPETVGLCVKRPGVNAETLAGHDKDDAFGRYLGEHDGVFVVAVIRLDYSGYSGCEVYSTLDELRRRWQLD